MGAEAQSLISGAALPYKRSAFGVQFSVFGVPQPGGSKTPVRTLDGRTFVRDSNKRAKPWKDQIQQVAGAMMEGKPLFRGPLAITVTFYVPRPKGHYGVKGLRPSAPKYPTVRPDVDKLSRTVLDACTGVVYKDDSQICRKLANKKYGEPARAEISVTVLV